MSDEQNNPVGGPKNPPAGNSVPVRIVLPDSLVNSIVVEEEDELDQDGKPFVICIKT
jgi:hypothetical protein